MDAGFAELRVQLDKVAQSINVRLGDLERREAGCQPLLQSRIDAAWRKIDDHEKKIEELTAIVVELRQANRILTWLGGVSGSAVVVWVIAQILGLVKP